MKFNKFLFVISLFFFSLCLDYDYAQIPNFPVIETNYTDNSIFSNICEAVNERCIAVGTQNVAQIEWVETRQINSVTQTVYQLLVTHTNTGVYNTILAIESVAIPDFTLPILTFNDGNDIDTWIKYPVYNYPRYQQTLDTDPYIIYNAFTEWSLAAVTTVKSAIEGVLPTETVTMIPFTFVYNIELILTNRWMDHISNSVSYITRNNLNLIDTKINELTPYFVLNVSDYLNGNGRLYQDFLQRTNVVGNNINYPNYLPAVIKANQMFYNNLGYQQDLTYDDFDYLDSGDAYWLYTDMPNFRFRLAEYTYQNNKWNKIYENGSNNLNGVSYPFYKYMFEDDTPYIQYISTNAWEDKTVNIRGNFIVNFHDQTLSIQMNRIR